VPVAATETLRAVLDAGGVARRLDELSTARVILKIAEQVHAAQQKAGAGKAIGPLTPSSITIEPSGAVVLGLAEPKAFAYAALEQISGGDGDRRSDVWSLGVIMWEALTHATLFEGGDDAAVQAAVKLQTIDPPATLNANIPAELSVICMRALARNPADRYQSAKVMGAEIEAVLDDAGYADNDDKIREFMVTLGQPKVEPKLSAPPLTVTPAQGVGVGDVTAPTAPPPEMLTPPPGPPSSTSPGMVIPRGDAEPVKSTQQPITVPARPATGTQPPIAKAEGHDKSEPVKRPSILDQEPAKPPASMTAASAGSLEVKAEGTLSPTSFLKPPTQPPAVASGANLAAALASAGTAPKPAPKHDDRVGFQTLQGTAITAVSPASSGSIHAAPSAVPMAPVLPANAQPAGSLPKLNASATAQGFASGDHVAPKLEAKPVTEPVVELKPKLAHEESEAKVVDEIVRARLDAKAAEEARAAAARAAEEAARSVAKGELQVGTDAKKRAPTNPDPAAAVSLPPVKAGRESAEVLGGWGWGTDSHPAIKLEGDDDDLHAAPTNKKTLIYVFGGLFALATIVIVVAFAFGGSKPAAKDPKIAELGSGSGSNVIAYGSGVEYGSATGDPTGGSAIASGAELGSAAVAVGSDTPTGSATIDTGSAVAAGSAVLATAGDSHTTDQADQKAAADQAAADQKAAADQAAAAQIAAARAAADKKAADKAAAEQAAADKKAAARAAAEQAAADKKAAADKRAADRAAAEQVAAEKRAAAKAAADKRAADAKVATRTEAKRPDKHVDRPAATHAVADPWPTKTEPATATKADAESAYRQGVQQFARGDTTAALASLRTSLASNPSFAPTWRGLGLVFEKMGDKDQARAAFKRYLQLAPNAGDADQVRNRMERLGS